MKETRLKNLSNANAPSHSTITPSHFVQEWSHRKSNTKSVKVQGSVEALQHLKEGQNEGN